MIDPKTLHIGSHVIVDGVRARVIRIDEPKDEHEIPPYTLLRFKAFIDGKWWNCGCPADADKVEPIPITAELLTELGFEKRESGLFAKEYAPDSWIFLTIYTTKELCKVNVYPSDPRKEASSVLNCYLHELEAFLYLTTKTELIKE
ncbi:MAG: hypothetical protein K2H46_02420 [Muribaculaceae bacterium]|nr:hypothetical protein [Muribaculaceae bacterium]